MVAIAQTNSAVLDSLFRQYSGWLNRWLKREFRSSQSSEDVASEVFVRLLTMQNIAELREPRAMMTTMARRIVYELRRRNDLQRAYEASLSHLPDALAPSPEDQAIMMETLRAVDLMLSGMSEKARKAFFHSQIDGMKYAEIAPLLGVSASMVRKYVAQGLRCICALDPSVS